MQCITIIDNVSYKLDITKNIDTINIIATNNFIKNSYSIALDNNKLKNIVSNAGLIYDMDNFYELIIISLNNSNPKIKLVGKLLNSKLILNLSIRLIEYLDHTINYIIILNEIVKSATVKSEKTITDINYLLNESRQELENSLVNLNLSKNKWINVDPADADYYFGYNKNYVFSQTVEDIKTVKIPDHIIQKSSKIKKLPVEINNSKKLLKI